MPFRIKAAALPTLFEKYKGKTFCSLETDTVPPLLKKGRVTKTTIKEKLNIDPRKIHKLSKFSAGIGYEYAQLVVNRLALSNKNPFDYEAGSSWHERYNGSTVIHRHKKTGELYFFVSLVANNPAKSEYRAGKKVIDVEMLTEFLPVESSPQNQGLDEARKVLVRILKLSSVKKLVAEKATFIITK